MTDLGALQAFLENKAPLSTAEAWDNPGLLVDAGTPQVCGVAVALDATPAAIDFAVQNGANVLLTHHPIIFDPLRQLTASHPAAMALAAGVSVLCMHTNLDKAAGGVNDTLAALLGLQQVEIAPDGMTRIGVLPAAMSSQVFGQYVAMILQTAVSYTTGRPVKRVAVCGGGAGSGIFSLDETVDAYVTGEMKHHEFLAAQQGQITACAAGHYATEVPVVQTLAAWLKEAFPALPVYPFADRAPYEFVTG